MEKKTLHIISLELPYPPNRGSVIGIFNRIKALHLAGVDVILHAFYKKFALADELAKYCKVIYQYPRLPMWKLDNIHQPLFVQSRRSQTLVDVLVKDNHPILFEGLHTTFHFNDVQLEGRKKFIRMHNIESNYYAHLATIENNLLKKWYYQYESAKALKLESSVLSKAHRVFSISTVEHHSFEHKGYRTTWIPPCIDTTVTSKAGRGDYALYHGDLSILENEKAALFLIEKVFCKLTLPLVVAGNRPSRKLIKSIQTNPMVRLYISPAQDEMNKLITEAHIILAPFSQTSGYKMKVLESITKGRHILTSENMKSFGELRPVLNFAASGEDNWKIKIEPLRNLTFDTSHIEARTHVLDAYFDPKTNIESMIRIIFG